MTLPAIDPAVADILATYTPLMRRRLVALRTLIYQVAENTPGVGALEEALRWGDPAYLTTQTKSGSLLRMNRLRNQQNTYALYFHCQTNLIEWYKFIFPNDFRYEKNRAILFSEDDSLPTKALSYCIAEALTYRIRR